MKKQKKLGLSPRGGAGRAVGYIGVLKALTEEDIKVHSIIGSSMGSILGAAFAAGFSIEQITDFTRYFHLDRLISLESIHDIAIAGDKSATRHFREIFGEMGIEDLKIKMFIQATNVNTRRNEVFSEGTLKNILAASCAFPFYSPPVKYGESTYIDGDITSGYGRETLIKSGAEVILGLSAGQTPTIIKHENIIARFLDPIMIATENLRRNDSLDEKLDIHIDNLGLDAGLFEHQRFPELIDNGYKVAKERMPEIKEKLEIRNPIFYWISKQFS